MSHRRFPRESYPYWCVISLLMGGSAACSLPGYDNTARAKPASGGSSDNDKGGTSAQFGTGGGNSGNSGQGGTSVSSAGTSTAGLAGAAGAAGTGGTGAAGLGGAASGGAAGTAGA